MRVSKEGRERGREGRVRWRHRLCVEVVVRTCVVLWHGGVYICVVFVCVCVCVDAAY